MSSPSARARDTAAIAGFEATMVDDLREWDYGNYEGRTTADIRAAARLSWLLWDDRAPNGERADDIGLRADRFLSRARSIRGRVLVFKHGHFLRVLAARWLRCPAGFGRRPVVAPATVSHLVWERGEPAIEAWNVPAVPA